MYALSFKIRHTVYHRIETLGGMDSEPGPITIDEDVITVVVPKDDDYFRTAARNYVLRYSGHSNDKGFSFVDAPVVTRVHAILKDAKTRLD